MRIRSIGPALAALAMLAGCGAPSTQANDTPPVAATPRAIDTDRPAAAEDVAPASAPRTYAAPAGDEDAMTIDDTAQGAANLVRHYYADLNRGDFRAAYARWGDEGRDSHQSFADFKRGFAETATTSVEVGAPGDGEGGAGSIYIDVPVTIHARLKDGTEQRFTGTYALRRVNDVPGSTQAQRRWHIYSASLKNG